MTDEFKPWTDIKFPSQLVESYDMYVGSELATVYIAIRFPVPILGTIYTDGLSFEGETLFDIRCEQIKDMIASKVSYKEFVFRWNKEERRNPLPYSIEIFRDLESDKMKILIEYNRKKYIEMATYSLNAEKWSQEYIRYAEANIRIGKLMEVIKCQTSLPD